MIKYNTIVTTLEFTETYKVSEPKSDDLSGNYGSNMKRVLSSRDFKKRKSVWINPPKMCHSLLKKQIKTWENDNIDDLSLMFYRMLDCFKEKNIRFVYNDDMIYDEFVKFMFRYKDGQKNIDTVKYPKIKNEFNEYIDYGVYETDLEEFNEQYGDQILDKLELYVNIFKKDFYSMELIPFNHVSFYRFFMSFVDVLDHLEASTHSSDSDFYNDIDDDY